MKKALALLGLATLALVSMASAAGANTGSVSTSQNCQTWSASVTLNSDVSITHWVEVVSTIPGTKNIAKEHAQGPQTLWSASGTAPESGSVTLTIYLQNGTTVEHSYTKWLPPTVDCETTTTVAPTTTTTVAPTTTTTEAPTTTLPPKDTTTIFVTTSTTAPPPIASTSTAPPGNVTTTTGPSCTPGIPPCAHTGTNTKAPLAVGVVALATGGALVLSTKKRRHINN